MGAGVLISNSNRYPNYMRLAPTLVGISEISSAKKKVLYYPGKLRPLYLVRLVSIFVILTIVTYLREPDSNH